MADTDHNRQDSLAPRIILPMAANKAQVEDLEFLSGFVVHGVPHEFQATLVPVNLLTLGCQATKTFEEVVTGESHADLLLRDGERVRVHPESASKLVSRWQVGSEKLLAGQRKEAILRNRRPKPSTLALPCCLANSTSTHPPQPSSFKSVCEPALLTRSACCRSLRYLPICSGEKLYTPPPSPHFWLKGIFQGRGVGVYILRPHAAGILYAPPPFYTPPTPRRVFSGVGGVGVYKIWPRICFAVGTKHAGTLPALSSRRRKRLGAPSSLESRSFTARWRFRSSCLDSPPDQGRVPSRTKQSYGWQNVRFLSLVPRELGRHVCRTKLPPKKF